MKNYDVIGMGLAAKDHLVVTEHYPENDTKTKMLGYATFGGGPVATAMVASARWGLRTGILTAVGDDDAGRFIIESLEQEGVDTSYTRILKDYVSPQPFIVVERSSGRRTIFEWHVGSGFLSWDETFAAPIRNSRFLLVDCRNVEAEISAARTIHEAGGRGMLDCGHPRDGFFDLTRHVDCLLLSHSFLKGYWGNDAIPEEALREMYGWGPSVCGFTLGDRGSIICDRGDIVRTPGFVVDAVDSTGAGDVFHAGFLYGLSQGWDVRRTCLYANAAAALSCTSIGGRAGIPTHHQVQTLLERAVPGGESAD